MKKFRIVFTFGLFFAAINMPNVLGQETKTPSEDFWIAECNTRDGGRMRCVISQTLTQAKTNLRLLSVRLSKPSADGPVRLTVQLPHGVQLLEGVRMSVDDNKVHLIPITEADQNGSYASINLTKAMLADLINGEKLNIRVKNKSNADVNFALSLSGFTKASSYLSLR